MPEPDRLDPGLRRALTLAVEDARGRGHAHLGTGHLLMGVLGVPYAPGARVLGRLGVILHDVDAEIVRIAGYGRRTPAPGVAGGAAGAGGPSDDRTDAPTMADEDLFGRPDAPRHRWFRRAAPLPSSAAGAALRYASAAGGATIGTEHLVLGLVAGPDGLAHRILSGHGVNIDRVHELLPTE